jgi:hypothetical protein
MRPPATHQRIGALRGGCGVRLRSSDSRTLGLERRSQRFAHTSERALSRSRLGARVGRGCQLAAQRSGIGFEGGAAVGELASLARNGNAALGGAGEPRAQLRRLGARRLKLSAERAGVRGSGRKRRRGGCGCRSRRRSAAAARRCARVLLASIRRRRLRCGSHVHVASAQRGAEGLRKASGHERHGVATRCAAAHQRCTRPGPRMSRAAARRQAWRRSRRRRRCDGLGACAGWRLSRLKSLISLGNPFPRALAHPAAPRAFPHHALYMEHRTRAAALQRKAPKSVVVDPKTAKSQISVANPAPGCVTGVDEPHPQQPQRRAACAAPCRLPPRRRCSNARRDGAACRAAARRSGVSATPAAARHVVLRLARVSRLCEPPLLSLTLTVFASALACLLLPRRHAQGCVVRHRRHADAQRRPALCCVRARCPRRAAQAASLAAPSAASRCAVAR